MEKFKIWRKNSRSKSKSSVVILRATDFNSVVLIDLKSVGARYILWIVCAFIKFVKGAVLNDKRPEAMIRALHRT